METDAGLEKHVKKTTKWDEEPLHGILLLRTPASHVCCARWMDGDGWWMDA